MTKELIRFGVSIEKNLLRQFDRLINEHGYQNRSEAIRDLIRDELVQQQWEDANAESVGTITLIYDHHVRELTELLTSVQHHYNAQIISTTHVHLDHDHCLEVILVRGKTETIRQISNQLTCLKGVKHGKLVTTTTGRNI